MPRVKQWTNEDRERALEWVVRKAATGVVFRTTTGTVSTELEVLLELADPDAVAERLRESLTDEAWKRLLGALRQRKHQAEKDQAGAEDHADDQQEIDECQRCAVLEARMLDMHAEIESLRAELAQEHKVIRVFRERSVYLEEYIGDLGLLDEAGQPIEDLQIVDAAEPATTGAPAEDDPQAAG